MTNLDILKAAANLKESMNNHGDKLDSNLIATEVVQNLVNQSMNISMNHIRQAFNKTKASIMSRSRLIDLDDKTNIYTFVHSYCQELGKFDKDMSYIRKMKVMNSLKLPIWDKNLHTSALDFLMNIYLKKMLSLSTFCLLEIAAFTHKVFHKCLEEEIMKTIIDTARPYVKTEILYNDDCCKNIAHFYKLTASL